MKDNLNENAEEEARRKRTERINAIKNSVRNAPAEKPAEPPAADDNDWESLLAARIARRTEDVRSKKTGAADIIADLGTPENNVSHASDIADEDAVSHVKTPESAEKPVSHVKETAAAGTHTDEKPVSHFKETPEESVSHAEETVAENINKEEQKEPPKKKKKKKKKRTFKEYILGFFPQKKDSIPERIRKVVFLCSIIAIIVCGYMIGDYYIDLWRSKRDTNKYMDNYRSYTIPEHEDPTVSVEVPDTRKVYTLLDGAKYLLDINKDVVGCITIPGTSVNNPLLQSNDNDKYMSIKMDGRDSRAGEIFLDYRNHFDEVDEEGHLKFPNSDNLIIYGHNMNDEQMFGSLKYYQRNPDYYGEHPIIELNSNYEQYKYKIFAFFILDAKDESDTRFDCWNKINFTDEADFYSFVNEAKRRSLRLNDVDVKYGDKLVTLSTCNTLLGERGRLIIMGRLVRDGEDPMEGTQDSTENTNIKWPSLYYQYRQGSKKYDPEAEFVPYGPESREK